MDNETAARLLEDERRRVTALISETAIDGSSDRQAENETGDIADPAASLTSEGTDDAVLASLRARLDAITRAEQRLRDGTYGISVRSGAPIPDERLEADPAAELTREEAAQNP